MIISTFQKFVTARNSELLQCHLSKLTHLLYSKTLVLLAVHNIMHKNMYFKFTMSLLSTVRFTIAFKGRKDQSMHGSKHTQ